MTKSWDIHKAEIKKLYTEHPLAVVQQIMLEKHNFKASTRAYRQRLYKWNVRKYNSRRANGGECSLSSPEGSASEAGSVSPVLSPHSVPADRHGSSAPLPSGTGYGSHDDHETRLGHSYSVADTISSRSYDGSYGRSRATGTSPHGDGHGGSSLEPYLAVPTTSWSHSSMPSPSAPYYGYSSTPLSPPFSTYQQNSYEPDQYQRRQSFTSSTTQQSNTTHATLPYPVARDYGSYGQSSSGDYDSARYYRDSGHRSSDASARSRSRNY
ncbi:hypothetical protein F5Y16DRAFT_374046 [Xylariaceae sp. FL0255]|nr:hypothetical protein F5Y16DRAFT_374046 [Xylariaceae sp. FL0255]